MALRSNAPNESDYETLMQRLHISGNSNGNSVATSSASPTALNHDPRQRIQRQQQQMGEEYRMYERSNIIAASKYATPKQIEQLHLQQTHLSRTNAEIPLNGASSTTPDLYEVTAAKRRSPVYENLDFYQSSSAGALGVSAKHFDSINRRAQPQCPATMGQPTPIQRGHYMVMQSQLPSPASVHSGGGHVLRYAHTPVPEPDSAPIYENMRVIPNSGQRAQPQASPATATIYQHHNIDGLSSPQHHTNLTTRALQQQQQKSQLNSEHSSDIHANSNNLDLLASPMHRRSTSNSSLRSAASTAAVQSGLTAVGEPKSPIQRYRNLSSQTGQLANVPLSPSKSYTSSIASGNDYKLHQHTPLKTMVRNANQVLSIFVSITLLFFQQHTAGINVSVNPNYIEEINSSDYVCMTANLNNTSMSKPQKPLPSYCVENPQQKSSLAAAIEARRISPTGSANNSKLFAPIQQANNNINATGNNNAISPTPSQTSSTGECFFL